MTLVSNSSSSATSCSDSDETFDLDEDDVVVDKDCTWLQANRYALAGEEDLCDWLHIASRCPNTCGSCDEFANAWQQ